MPGGDEMRPAYPGVKLTYDDFLLFPEDGKRHELIDGEHYVTASPNTRHQVIAGNLHFLIRAFLETHPAGRVFVAPLDVVFSHFDVVEPDLLYVSRERMDVVTKPNLKGAPDLVVEIGSESTRVRDETIKRRLYDRFAVAEYWVVDPDLEVIKVHRRVGEHYARVAELAVENRDTLTTPLLPGLEMPLAKIFED